MTQANLSCLTISILLAGAISQRVSVPNRGCVPAFQETPGDFDVCKSKLCFVILPEKPYVIPETGFETATPHPFRCLGTDKYSGVFFDLLKKAGKSVHELRDAMCVYGGRSCSFDNSVRFVEDNAKLDHRYRFIAGGFLLFMPHRRTLHTVHSQPWSSEKMVVLLRNDGSKRSFRFAWEQVFQPYSRKGWGILLGLMGLFCVALAIHTYRFSPARTFRGLIRWFALSNPSQRGVWETASWASLRLAVIVFFAVSILLYEVSYLILSDSDNIGDIEELKSLGLTNFAVVEGDASETIFKYAVGWDNNKRKIPWVSVKTLDDAIALVRNKRVKYAFSFELIVATILRRDNLCDKISAIPTVKRDSGGWYYGTTISPQLRQRIDEALATLVLEDLPRKSMKAFGMSPLNCGNMTGELDYKVLLFILLLTVGPILLKHIIALILSCYWPDIENPDIPTDAESRTGPKAVPEEYVPHVSSSNSSSSQLSDISRLTRNNTSTFTCLKTPVGARTTIPYYQ